MTVRRFVYAVACGSIVAGLSFPAAAAAQTSGPSTAGSTTYATYCASCHGPSAKGDGPLASMMTVHPPDLTLIAKRNGGTFPADQVARRIDGRNPVKGHGGGEMPVWGDAFSKSLDPMPAEARIKGLVAYLESIQVKP